MVGRVDECCQASWMVAAEVRLWKEPPEAFGEGADKEDVADRLGMEAA
jgi:hypothetical protein